MASAAAAAEAVGAIRHVYTLNGFGRDYDRRPTEFLVSFPPARVCCLCGVVPDKTALLPCRDVLCRICFDKSLEADDGACPLHVGTSIDEEDVEWRVLSFKEVSRKKVRCWNAMNGCPVECELLEMSEHWYSECQFHNTVCTKCKKRVLQKDIVQHIRDGCASQILRRVHHITASSEPGGLVNNSSGVPQPQRFDAATTATSDVMYAFNNLLGEQLASLKKNIQEHVTYERKQCEYMFTQCLEAAKLDTLSAMKDHVTEANNTHNDACSQIKEDLMNIGRGVGEQLEAATKNNHEAMKQLQDLVAKKCEKTIRMSRKTLEFASSVPNSYEWVVRGWAEMKSKALAQGEAWDFSQPRYFCGYLLKPAILVYKDEDRELRVHAGFELRKGSVDDCLDWPFCKSCRLTFVHPRVRPTARSLTLTPDAETFSEGLAKPKGGDNAAVFSAGNYCHARDLENEGYVSADEIRIRFEVML